MSGDDGDDVIYGDFKNFNVPSPEDFPESDHGLNGPGVPNLFGNILALGDDRLIGGNGDDVLWGDTPEIDGIANWAAKWIDDSLIQDFEDIFSADDLVPVTVTDNAVIWGNDTLEGGHGKDKFAFALADLDGDGDLEMQGDDVIVDFTVGLDMLQFSGVGAHGADGVEALNGLIGTDITFFSIAAGVGVDAYTSISFVDGGSITIHGVALESFSVANTMVVS